MWDIITRTNRVLLWSLLEKAGAINRDPTRGMDQLGKDRFHYMISTNTWKTSARLLSSGLRLHLLPEGHKHQRPNSKESELQPQVTRHPHVDPGTPPNRTGHATGIVAVLNEQAGLPVPLMRHLLGHQTERDRAREVEPERDEEPSREQAAERRAAAAHGGDGDGDRDEQAEQAQRATSREDVPVLHATREHHVGEHERERAHAAERDQVPRDEGRRAERARREDRDVCFPRAQHEEARHRKPAHRRRDGPLLRGDSTHLRLHVVFRGGVPCSCFSAWGRRFRLCLLDHPAAWK